MKAVLRTPEEVYRGAAGEIGRTGCVLIFPDSEVAPTLALRTKVLIDFSGGHLDNKVTIGAFVKDRFQPSGARVYRFRFMRRKGQSPDQVFLVCNGRRAVRADAVQTYPVHLWPLKTGAYDDKPVVTAEMSTLSTTGVGLVLSVREELSLVDVDALRMLVELPTFSCAQEFFGTIIYRYLRASKTVGYGVNFSEEVANLEAKRQRIQLYVDKVNQNLWTRKQADPKVA